MIKTHEIKNVTDFNVADSVRRDIKVLVTKTRYTVFLDIVRVLSNFMNFHVASMNGNNSTFYGDLKIQKQLSRSTFIIRER